MKNCHKKGFFLQENFRNNEKIFCQVDFEEMMFVYLFFAEFCAAMVSVNHQKY